MSDKLEEDLLKAWAPIVQRGQPRCRHCQRRLKGGTQAQMHIVVRNYGADFFVLCQDCHNSTTMPLSILEDVEQSKAKSKPDTISVAQARQSCGR